MRLPLRAAPFLVLVALGLGPGAAAQDADVRLMKVAEVTKRLTQKEKVLIVDVRSSQEFLARHIKGAVSIPLAQIEQRHGEVPRQGLVVLY
jgi:rhodanese-related sulfurtransferase